MFHTVVQQACVILSFTLIVNDVLYARPLDWFFLIVIVETRLRCRTHRLFVQSSTGPMTHILRRHGVLYRITLANDIIGKLGVMEFPL